MKIKYISQKNIKNMNLLYNYLDQFYNDIGIYELINKNALYYFPLIKHQTKNLCLTAVTKNKKCLQYVKNKDLDICLAASTTDDINIIKQINPEFLGECIKKINNSKHMITKCEKIDKITIIDNTITIDTSSYSINNKYYEKPIFNKYVKKVNKLKHYNYYKKI